MRYLIDTNIFIWWLEDPDKLKDSIHHILEDPQNQIIVSVIAAVEISIKQKLGKIKLKTTLKRMFELASFETLSLNLDHVFKLKELPLHHKDPFDRILISQAKVEGLTLITSNEKIWKYNIFLIQA